MIKFKDALELARELRLEDKFLCEYSKHENTERAIKKILSRTHKNIVLTLTGDEFNIQSFVHDIFVNFVTWCTILERDEFTYPVWTDMQHVPLEISNLVKKEFNDYFDDAVQVKKKAMEDYMKEIGNK